MTMFDRREKGEEAKYARNEELSFKIKARRNKLLGLWAAERMGMQGADADAYAKECVLADFENPGDEDLYLKVMEDLKKANAQVSEHDMRRKMAGLLETAREEVEKAANKTRVPTWA